MMTKCDFSRKAGRGFLVGRIYAIYFLLMSLLLTPTVLAQEKNPPTVSFEGPEFFCHILHRLDMKPIVKIDRAELSPAETVIIVLGESHILDEINRTIKGFTRYLEQGGSLLIATHTPGKIPDLPITIDPHIVMQSENDAYRKKPQCPWLHHPTPNGFFEAGHPLFQQLQHGIATNGPSWLLCQPNDVLVPLWNFPEDVWYYLPTWNNEKLEMKRATATRYYMAGSPANAPPHGRVLVIAGHGMFMNGMMQFDMQPRIDNRAFTENAIKWLLEKKQGKRTQALLVVDGKIITDFDASLHPPPPPVLTQTINQMLRGMEDERFFHQIPPLLQEKLATERGAALVLCFLSLVLLLFGVKQFMQSRHFQDTSVPLAVGAQTETTSVSALNRQRQHEIIQRDNYWEVARAIIHEWLREQFYVMPGSGLPVELRIEIPGNRSLQRQVDFVMVLLCAIEPIKVSEKDFVSLAQGLTLLNQALKENQLALLVEGKKVRQLLR
jgi:hypothetical protein